MRTFTIISASSVTVEDNILKILNESNPNKNSIPIAHIFFISEIFIRNRDSDRESFMFDINNDYEIVTRPHNSSDDDWRCTFFY